MKTFLEFVQKINDVEAGKLEIVSTSVDKAYEYAKSKLDVDKDIPNFKKNYLFAQKQASKGHTKRIDMPVIKSKDIVDFQQRLKQGYIDINKPLGHNTNKDNPFPEGLTGDMANKWLEGGLKKYDGSDNDDKVSVKKLKVPVKLLTPIQEQIYFDKSLGTIIRNGIEETYKFLDSKTTIISSDRYVIDGHHRYLTAVLLDPNYKANCLVIDLPLKKLLPMSVAYGDSVGNERNK